MWNSRNRRCDYPVDELLHYSFCYGKPELLPWGLWCTSYTAYLVVLEGCWVLVWISVSDTISLSISSACGHRGLHPSSSWAAQETLAAEDRWHQQGAAEGNGSEVSRPACRLSDCHLYGNWPKLNPQGYRGLGFVYLALQVSEESVVLSVLFFVFCLLRSISLYLK